MKLVALRIDEEQKARLEQLAEERDVTLSRAFREGAILYLNELREKAHKARGGDVTFLGIRRDEDGRILNKPSTATAGQRERVRELAEAIQKRGLGDIQAAYESGASAGVVLASLGQWLSLVGQLYVSNSGEVGWDWFLRDYCPGYQSREASGSLRDAIRRSLIADQPVDLRTVLDSLNAGCRRLLEDAESQDAVRRAILPAWDVFAREGHE
jgi:predicted transcriptional regulator